MFLDAVLDKGLNPIYNSIPIEVKEFLEARTDEENDKVDVYIGQLHKIVTVPEYFEHLNG
jgi:hypothetical protein